MPAENIAVHVALTETLPGPEEQNRLYDLEEELMSDSTLSRLASFEGNLIGGGEWVFYFETKSAGSFLSRVREILIDRNCVSGSYAERETTGAAPGQRIDLEREIDSAGLVFKKKGRSARIGDYYSIPLEGMRWAHALYLTKQPGFGDLVQVLGVYREKDPATVDELIHAPRAFPPVFAWVRFCSETYAWRFLGNRRAHGKVVLPPFRHSLSADESGRKPGVYHDWTITVFEPDGNDQIKFVGTLSEEERKLEVARVWFAEELHERIASGINPDSLLL